MIQKILAIIAGFGLLASGNAFGVDPEEKINNAWISIGGVVDKVEKDRFTLDYGDGSVTVEMDDGDRDADAYVLQKGDNVTVTGFIDRDSFEKTKIEAGTVYVENINTTFYSSPLDEEDPSYSFYSYTVTPVMPVSAVIKGIVEGIDGREFTMKTGRTTLTVDTKAMAENPLDNKGYLQLAKGDRVSVSGEMKKSFWTGRKLEASAIIKYKEPVVKVSE